MEKSSKKVYRLGIMGGTFDPVHYGHLVAAETARVEFKLNKVLFIPTGTPPHKDSHKVTPAGFRYEMVKYSIADNPYFKISDIEIKREGPSYTIDTLRALKESWPDQELYFITGTDALRELFFWREAEEILSLTHVVGAARPGFDATEFLQKVQHDHSKIMDRIHYFEVPALAISSTDIRARLKSGKSIRYLLPEEVRSYITEKRLYT